MRVWSFCNLCIAQGVQHAITPLSVSSMGFTPIPKHLLTKAFHVQVAPWEMMEEEEGAQQQQHGDVVQPIDTHGGAASTANNPQATSSGNTQLLASPHEQVSHTIGAACPCYDAYCPPLLLFIVASANHSSLLTLMCIYHTPSGFAFFQRCSAVVKGPKAECIRLGM